MGKRRSLLEAAFQNEKVKQARVKKELSVERAVQKCIVDNFKGFSDAEIDGTQVDNMTLRQRLLRDKSGKSSGGEEAVVMGARYYKDLRSLYSSSSNPLKNLVVTDGSTPGKEVFDAMVAAKRPPCNRGPLIHFLTTAGAPNMCEAMGIMKWVLELNPGGSAEQLRGVLEAMKWMGRHNLQSAYPREFSNLSAKLNEALVVAPSLFWQGCMFGSMVIGSWQACGVLLLLHALFQRCCVSFGVAPCVQALVFESWVWFSMGV